MKKWFKQYSGALAAFAMMITTLTANSACIYIMHQDKLPEEANKLRKF